MLSAKRDNLAMAHFQQFVVSVEPLVKKDEYSVAIKVRDIISLEQNSRF